MNQEINKLLNIIKPEKIKLNEKYIFLKTLKMLFYYSAIFFLLFIIFSNRQSFELNKYRNNVKIFLNATNVE